MAFPCNQFNQQEKGTNEEIRAFYENNYGVKFPIMAKIDVNGENEIPLYTYLKEEQGDQPDDSIKWNFTKFLVDKQGNVVNRYTPQTTPESFEEDIVALL